MTQEALALAAGVSAQTVKRAEAGKSVSAETVLALCSALGITPDGLAPAVRDAVVGADDGVGTGACRGRPVGTGSQPTDRRLSRLLDWAMVAVGSTYLEVRALSALDEAPGYFRGTQIVVLTLVALVVVLHAADSYAALAKSGATGGRLAKVVACVVALAVMGGCAGRFVVTLGEIRTASSMRLADSKALAMHADVVDRLAAAHPGYDRTLDDWYVARERAAVTGRTLPGQETPGTWKARRAVLDRCWRDWSTAPTYDEGLCSDYGMPQPRSPAAEVVKAFVGGPLVDRAPVIAAVIHFMDGRYDPVRAEARREVDAMDWGPVR